MKKAGRDAGVEMRRALSTNKKSKWTFVCDVKPKDRGDKSWMTENQMVGRLPDDVWWTVDTRGTNPVIVEKHSMETRRGTSASSGLASLSSLLELSRLSRGAVVLLAFPAYLFIYLFIPLE